MSSLPALTEEGQSHLGALVRLGQDGARRLLENLVPGQLGALLGEVGVGDAALRGEMFSFMVFKLRIVDSKRLCKAPSLLR